MNFPCNKIIAHSHTRYMAAVLPVLGAKSVQDTFYYIEPTAFVTGIQTS